MKSDIHDGFIPKLHQLFELVWRAKDSLFINYRFV